MEQNRTGDSDTIVIQALSFQTPDRLGVYESFWPEFETKWQEEKGLADDAVIEDHFSMDIEVLVADETFFPTCSGRVGQDEEYILLNDGWGRIVRTRPGTYFSETVEHIFNKKTDLDKIKFDSPGLDCRYANLVEQVNQSRRKGKFVFVKIGGVFIRSSFFRGGSEVLMDMAYDESFAVVTAQKVANHLLAIGLESLRRTNTYDTGVWIADDMCNANGPMFSPLTFEKIFLPIYKDMISKLKAAGTARVVLHCDGNLTDLLDMLIEAGFDGINPVERNAGLIVEKLVPKYHGKLFFIGGVCNTQILPNGSDNEIRRHVETIIDAGAEGGLVIGTHSVGPDIPIQNYELYRRIFIEKGVYK